MNPPPVQDTTPASEATTYDHPTVPRESETDPDAPVIYAQKQLYLSSPGLYEAELDAFRDEASLDMYMRYYYSIHVPSLRHSTRPDLRHIEDEVAHYIIWLESVPPSPILSLISPVGPIHPSSCILGFLFGEELSGWLTARRRPPLTRGWVPTLPFTPRAHLPHTGSTVTVPPDSWTTRFQPWESDWAPPRLRMCARILTCLQLSRVAPAPHGLLATMRDFHEEFEYQYLPHTRTRPHVPLPGLPWTHRFSARLAILRSDNTVSTSIHIAFDSYEWAVAHNIATRSWNTARRSHVIHDTRRFSSHDPLGNPWEPDGYLEECGRPVRHDAHTLPPRDDWHQRAPFGIAASVFSIPLPPATLDAIRALFQTDAQRVVLEFYSHETAPRLVLAGDTMARRPISIPDPHLTSRHPLMPEVVAATSLSRRGYSSHSPLSRATGGDMFVSFHAGLGPPTHFEDERIDAREDDALWGLARRALPRYVSDGNALTRPPASGEGSTRPGSPSLRHVEVVIQTRPARVNRNPNLEQDPNTWRLLWFIIGGTIPHFLVGRAYANWLSYKNSVQYTHYLTSPIQEIFDPVGYRVPQQFQGQSWLHLRLRQASRELSRIIVGLSLHSDGGRRPTPLTTMLHTCRDHLHYWNIPPPHQPTHVDAILATRCPRISVRINLLDDADVVSDSVLITCPPGDIVQYVSDAWLPSGPLHYLLEPREVEAVANAIPFYDAPPLLTDPPSPFWEKCGYNNDGLPFADRAERLPGVVPRRGGDLGVSASAFAIPIPTSALSQVSNWITSQSPRGARALVQVHYPTIHNRLYTVLAGDRIDPPALHTGIPRTDRHPHSQRVPPTAGQRRVASSFRARTAYPDPVHAPSPSPCRPRVNDTELASGDLFITIPTFDDIVPTSLWEWLHKAAQCTIPLATGWVRTHRDIHLNPGLDMPQPPACSQWRFRPAEMLIQTRRPAHPAPPPLPPSTHTDGCDTRTGDTHLPEHGRK